MAAAFSKKFAEAGKRKLCGTFRTLMAVRQQLFQQHIQQGQNEKRSQR